jgi:hypothetical protein
LADTVNWGAPMNTTPSVFSESRSFLLTLSFTLLGALICSAAVLAGNPHDFTGETACAGCHLPGELAPQAPASPVIATHQDLLCTDCHDSHGMTSNLHLVREIILTPSSGPRDVIFIRYVGDNSYADGDTVYDGVCEVCHTTTAYHRNDASGDHTHETATKCTNCHTHDAGFDPPPVTSAIGEERTTGSMRVFPSPSRGPVTIQIALPVASDELRAVVCDVNGRRVRELAVDEVQGGRVVLHWDGKTAGGVPVRSGVYFCRVETQGQRLQSRFLLIR